MPRDHFLTNSRPSAAVLAYERTGTFRERRRKAILGNILASLLTAGGILAVVAKAWSLGL